jgi:hypothetical protein
MFFNRTLEEIKRRARLIEMLLKRKLLSSLVHVTRLTSSRESSLHRLRVLDRLLSGLCLNNGLTL